MAHKIEEIITQDASAAAASFETSGRPFLLANDSGNGALYFRDCTEDNTAATSANGFPVAAGTTLPFVLRAGKISVIGAKVKIMYLAEV